MQVEELNENFNASFRARDLEALVAFYEADAVLVPAQGVPARGHAAIRGRLGALLNLQGRLSATQTGCIRVGELALLQAEWEFQGSSPHGEPVRLAGRSLKLARRQADGRWLYVIDAPG